MSLKGKKRNNPPPSFVIKGGAKKEGHVVMIEKNEDGSLGMWDEQMEFTAENLRDKPIDLLTHEFSEREVKRAMESAGEDPASHVTRYSEDGKPIRVPVRHAMVSHHTESGIVSESEHKKFSPEDFERFFWETGVPSYVFPKQVEIKNKWNAVMREGARAAKAGNKAELILLVNRAKNIRDNAVGDVEPIFIRKMDQMIELIDK